jgi:hypothetical protein
VPPFRRLCRVPAKLLYLQVAQVTRKTRSQFSWVSFRMVSSS